MPTASQVEDRLGLLSAVPLLAGLTKDQLEALAVRGREQSFAAGDVIVREGQVASGLYLILGGVAEVRRAGRPVARLSAGEFFGEAALVLDQPRTADVVAVTALRCLVLDRWEFWGAVGIDPRVDRALFEETVRRLRRFRTEMVE